MSDYGPEVEEIRKAVVDLLKLNDNWPSHGNAPLAIAAVVANLQADNARLRAELEQAKLDLNHSAYTGDKARQERDKSESDAAKLAARVKELEAEVSMLKETYPSFTLASLTTERDQARAESSAKDAELANLTRKIASIQAAVLFVRLAAKNTPAIALGCLLDDAAWKEHNLDGTFNREVEKATEPLRAKYAAMRHEMMLKGHVCGIGPCYLCNLINDKEVVAWLAAHDEAVRREGEDRILAIVERERACFIRREEVSMLDRDMKIRTQLRNEIISEAKALRSEAGLKP